MFWSVTLSLLEGLREVVKLFALTLVFSLPLGLAVTFGSMSKCRPVSWFFNVLVWIVRGTPLMLQLIRRAVASQNARSSSEKTRSLNRGVRLRIRSMRAISTMSTPTPARAMCYSTVTDFARLRGLSTSQPRASAT